MSAPAAQSEYEQRIKALEKRVADLEQSLQSAARTKPQWITRIGGQFADDPDFEQIVNFGREWRASLRNQD